MEAQMPAAAIGGVAALGGALISSNASRGAADTVSDSTDQQIALQREIYNDTTARQEPFYQTGVAANAAASELLGLGQTQQSGFRFPNGQGLSPAYGQYQAQNDNGFYISDGQGGFRATGAGAAGSLSTGGNNGLSLAPPPQEQGGAAQNQLTSNGQPIYQNAQLTATQQSPGYQFRMQEGMNQLETGAAARGGLLSGNHIKAATRYAQDYASNEYNNRFNQLQALQSGGQAAANNVQNAGSNYANNTSNALANNAQYQAGAQQQRGSIYSNALGGLGGLVAGAI